MKREVIAWAFLGLVGCTPFGGFKAPPPGWTYFAGHGATQREIESAYLECGFPVPGDFRETPNEVLTLLGFGSPDARVGNVSKQYAALAEKYYCMKNAGFPVGELTDPCLPGKRSTGELVYPNYPACQPGAVIPKRSTENRLNSPYCKLYPKANICQADYDPAEAELKKPIQANRTIDSTSITPSESPATTLQDQVQKDSNSKMNDLLQNTSTRK